ncbi:MAG: universal stress protein [Gemmatimonadales bacterium]|jgi:nucleotide-binding universal stress UspA family protein
MLDIKKIVYATDFSPCSENAFPIAVRLAASHDAELHMVHAIVLHADDPHDPAHHFPEPDELYERMRSSAEARMATAAENGGMPHLKIVRAQVRGISPAPVILEYAEEQGVDMIVMGTHGRRGLRHLLLGSVAEEVVRMADCPVLTVREDAASASAFGRILVPMDYSDNSEVALGYAREIASSEGASLHLLHVLEVGTYPDFYFPVQASQMFDMPELKERALQHLRDRLEKEGPEVPEELHVELGHPAQNIVEYAERAEIDLIVLASHGRTGLERALLGSVAEGVTRRAQCPVLIVKPPEEAFST